MPRGKRSTEASSETRRRSTRIADRPSTSSKSETESPSPAKKPRRVSKKAATATAAEEQSLEAQPVVQEQVSAELTESETTGKISEKAGIDETKTESPVVQSKTPEKPAVEQNEKPSEGQDKTPEKPVVVQSKTPEKPAVERNEKPSEGQDKTPEKPAVIHQETPVNTTDFRHETPKQPADPQSEPSEKPSAVKQNDAPKLEKANDKGDFEFVNKDCIPAADAAEVQEAIKAQGEDGALLVNYVQVSKSEVPAADSNEVEAAAQKAIPPTPPSTPCEEVAPTVINGDTLNNCSDTKLNNSMATPSSVNGGLQCTTTIVN